MQIEREAWTRKTHRTAAGTQQVQCECLLLWLQNLAPLKLLPDNSLQLDLHGSA